MVSVFAVARQRGRLAPTQLILCGVVMAAFYEAITSFLIFRGNPQATQSVLFWLLRSFGLASWQQLPIPAVVLLAAADGHLRRSGGQPRPDRPAVQARRAARLPAHLLGRLGAGRAGEGRDRRRP